MKSGNPVIFRKLGTEGAGRRTTRYERYPNLFSPGHIGKLKIPNRLVMAPVATNYASETGGMTEALLDFYESRARGGTGLIIVENCCVDFPSGKAGATQIRLDEDRFVPGISRLAETVRVHGGRVALQINHSGPSGVPSKTEGMGPVGASEIAYGPGAATPRALDRDEIEKLIERYAQAVLRAKKAGFDAVELHGGHGYLMAHFMCPLTNRRNDEYGGNLEGRLLFTVRIIRRCRDLVGADYPVMLRMNGDEFLEGARGLDESKQMARILASEGFDALHVTAGTHPSVHPSGTLYIEPMSYEQGWRVYLAEEIKSVVDIPVIAVGVIREPAFAEKIIAKGRADFVAMGRGLIADPDWPEKARTGRETSIRKCISCNEGCIRRRGAMDLPIRCALNAEVGLSRGYRMRPVGGGVKRVLVVGAGPAGMEAARVLKLRGHDVTLWEKMGVLGGQLLLAGVPWFKNKLLWFVEYLQDELKRLEVPCEMHREATPDNVLEFAPDELILATGAVPFYPSMPGIDLPHVKALEDVLKEDYKGSGAESAVLGGGIRGAEVALFLADRGECVTLIEKQGLAARDMEIRSRRDLLEKLEEHDVRILIGTEVFAIEKHGVQTHTGEENLFIEAVKVVPCFGYRSVNALKDTLEGKIPGIHMIGDCLSPRNLFYAVSEAYRVASRT